jgi:deoxyribodipyrimidine photo-lyase
VISAYAPVGWTADRLAAAEQELADRGIRLHRLCRPWDTALWPHAQSGFFSFAAKAKR